MMSFWPKMSHKKRFMAFLRLKLVSSEISVKLGTKTFRLNRAQVSNRSSKRRRSRTLYRLIGLRRLSKLIRRRSLTWTSAIKNEGSNVKWCKWNNASIRRLKMKDGRFLPKERCYTSHFPCMRPHLGYRSIVIRALWIRSSTRCTIGWKLWILTCRRTKNHLSGSRISYS